jgi:hypothetical protein
MNQIRVIINGITLKYWGILILNWLYTIIQDFPDGVFPARGKSEIEGIFPPPYFEWFQFDKVC